jgi:hypothetical protein
MKNFLITGRNSAIKSGERWGVTICKFKSRLRATSGIINTFKVTIVTVPAKPK